VRRLRLLRWRSGEKSGTAKADKLADIRRRTDQRIRRQELQKKREAAGLPVVGA